MYAGGPFGGGRAGGYTGSGPCPPPSCLSTGKGDQRRAIPLCPKRADTQWDACVRGRRTRLGAASWCYRVDHGHGCQEPDPAPSWAVARKAADVMQYGRFPKWTGIGRTGGSHSGISACVYPHQGQKSRTAAAAGTAPCAEKSRWCPPPAVERREVMPSGSAARKGSPPRSRANRGLPGARSACVPIPRGGPVGPATGHTRQARRRAPPRNLRGGRPGARPSPAVRRRSPTPRPASPPRPLPARPRNTG